MALRVPEACGLCPRRCGADRTKEAPGLCGGGPQVRAARAALHFWEEPCISGTRGSGTVFFSGCPLGCCYCQNYRISAENFGKVLTVPQLAAVFLRLQAQDAHNINLVTATHYAPWVTAALDEARAQGLRLPVVYNTGGYETEQTVRALAPYVDIWLTDMKYVSSALAGEYSAAPDYFAVAAPALRRMLAQAGPPVFGADGLLQRGVIVRHLALPGALRDSLAVLRFLAGLGPQNFLFSAMSQYTPFYRAAQHKALSRRISTYEYRTVVNEAVRLGLTNGYMQEKSSAREEYTPPFDLEGL
ncbi:MAG: radical SAM protein [Ruthenibacterium sp.]